MGSSVCHADRLPSFHPQEKPGAPWPIPSLSLLPHHMVLLTEQRESCDSSPQDFQAAVDHLEVRVTAVRPALPFSWPECGCEVVTHAPVKRVQCTTLLSAGNESVQDSCSLLCAF